MTDKCVLCDAAGENLVYRGPDGIVVLDDPVRPGHVLVGAAKHAENLHDLSPAEAGAVLQLANRVAKVVVTRLGAVKVYVVAIGDKDKHFHVHLLPKLPGDPNLGPHVFGPQGWIAFLAAPDATAVAAVSREVQLALKT